MRRKQIITDRVWVNVFLFCRQAQIHLVVDGHNSGGVHETGHGSMVDDRHNSPDHWHRVGNQGSGNHMVLNNGSMDNVAKKGEYSSIRILRS